MSNMTKVMIIDDDLSVCDRLRSMLERYEDFQVVGVAGTLEEAKETMSMISPDMLFLDVELPDGNGLSLLDFLHEYHPDVYVVVFTAFYNGISDEAYEHGESDYLLKPILQDELDKILRRYRSTLKVADNEEAVADARNTSVMMALQTVNNELRPTKSSDIGFFRYSGERRLWTAMLDDNTALTLRKGTTAKDILKLNPMFEQTHQAFIINLAYAGLVGYSHIRLKKPFELYSIPVGRSFQHTLYERFRLV